MVVVEQLLSGHVAPQLDVPEEPEALVLGSLVVGIGDRLDLRVVRGHARPDQAVRRRQAVIQVDRELRLVDRQQLTGGVEAARPCAYDRGTKGLGHTWSLQPELNSVPVSVRKTFVAQGT